MVIEICKYFSYNKYTGWSKDPGPPSGGEFPRYFYIQNEKDSCMSNKFLSVFIDESGDFALMKHILPTI